MSNNQILEHYKGFPIRSYNRITMRVDSRSYKELIDASIREGVSIRKIICISSIPCHHCKDTDVRTLSPDGRVISVTRGIIAKHIPQVITPRN